MELLYKNVSTVGLIDLPSPLYPPFLRYPALQSAYRVRHQLRNSFYVSVY